jgi:hypothetical protein
MTSLSNRLRRKFTPEVADARRKYRLHIHNATKRGVEFLLTFDEWWQIWKDSGKWTERGAGTDKYCMSRYGDEGPYAVGNVFINRFADNTSQGVTGIKRSEEQNKVRSGFMRGNTNSVGRKWMHKDAIVECIRKDEVQARIANGWLPGRKP